MRTISDDLADVLKYVVVNDTFIQLSEKYCKYSASLTFLNEIDQPYCME